MLFRSTVHNRRWQMGVIFESLTRLGLWDGPTEFGEPVHKKNGDATRPLTDAEVHRLRVHAYHALRPDRRWLAVALAECGGSALEIALAERDDIDLNACTVRFRGPDARVNPIPPEAFDAMVAAFDAGYTPVGDRRLVVGDDLDDMRAKRSVTQELSEAVRDAGLSRLHRVSGRDCSLDAKQPYEPAEAQRCVQRDAVHFLQGRARHLQRLEGAMDRRPLLVAPFDAELFGHWWYEGPQFLGALFRQAPSQGVDLVTLRETLSRGDAL